MKVEFTIPEKFEVKNYSVNLKDDLHGNFYTFSDNKESYFEVNLHGVSVKFNIDNIKSIDDIIQWILNIYLKGIEDPHLLDKEELAMFYFIKNAKDNKERNKVLFIGYEHDYLKTIKNVFSQISKCDTINLQKNLELYNQQDYDKLFKSIISKSNKYKKIIIDITNVYLLRDKYNTKNLVDYLLSKNKHVLLLVDRYPNVFLEIFGKEYRDNIIERKYVLESGTDQSVINYIKKVLF